MRKILLFGGTTEGKQVIELLERLELEAYVSVATRYGEQVLEKELRYCTVLVGRMDAPRIADFLREHQIALVIDATHPYAVEVTENILSACAQTGGKATYFRVKREQSARIADALYFPSMMAAARYLCGKSGNVLLTTGSKDLKSFAAVDGFRDRVYARLLPAEQSVRLALAAGLPKEHLILGQGPFCEERNIEDMKRCGARFLVTKDTGEAGGFPQKVSAAKRLGVQPLIVERPKTEGEETGGVTLAELEDYLERERGNLCGGL